MTEQEYTDELARMAERYKMDEGRRRVRMVAQPQNAGNARAIPEVPQSGPDLDEYAYVGSPSPPVTSYEAQFRPKLSTEQGQGPYPPLRAPGPFDARTATPVPRGYTYGDDQITRDPNGVPAWEQKPPNKDVAYDALTALVPAVGSSLAISAAKGAGLAGRYANQAANLANEYMPEIGAKIRELDQTYNPLNYLLPRSLPPEPPKRRGHAK